LGKRKETTMNNTRLLSRTCGFVLVLVTLAACGGEAQPTATATPIPPASTPFPPTATPIPPTATPVPPNPDAPPVKPIFMFDSRIYRAISYLPDWLLDVYLPEAEVGPYPTLLLLHGAGVNNESLSAIARHFAQRGYATVLPNWLTGKYPPERSMFSNAFCALAWTYSNAEAFGFDPERVVLFGHSAGGHVASVMGAVDDVTEFMEGCPYQLPVSDWTKAVVTYGGLFGTQEGYLSVERPDTTKTAFDFHSDSIKLTPDESAGLHKTLMDTAVEGWRGLSGLSAGEEELLHMLAPYWVDGSEPPFLLIHGETDVMYIGIDAPEALASQMQAAGSRAEVLLVPDAGHIAIFSRNNSGFKDTVEAMEDFFSEVLE
jgi:acetyl esterase/lipase